MSMMGQEHKVVLYRIWDVKVIFIEDNICFQVFFSCLHIKYWHPSWNIIYGLTPWSIFTTTVWCFTTVIFDRSYCFPPRTCPIVTTVVSMARAVRKAFRESYVDRCGPLGIKLCTKYRWPLTFSSSTSSSTGKKKGQIRWTLWQVCHWKPDCLRSSLLSNLLYRLSTLCKTWQSCGYMTVCYSGSHRIE